MIFCVWYPSGGFGHFINGIISVYGDNFLRPAEINYKFSETGDSHSLSLVAPKYYMDADAYTFDFNADKNYSVLVDNGVNNESKKFLKFFPNSKVIKICYSDRSWPIVAVTLIEKAMKEPLSEQIKLEGIWNVNEDWALREKYFLYLRDHPLRYKWKADPDTDNLFVEQLLNFHELQLALLKIGVLTENFQMLWDKWRISNGSYIFPVHQANQVIKLVKEGVDYDLTAIGSVWEQSVIYYFIWLEYNFEVPHNDYSIWFNNTKQIVTMLKEHGVYN